MLKEAEESIRQRMISVTSIIQNKALSARGQDVGIQTDDIITNRDFNSYGSTFYDNTGYGSSNYKQSPGSFIRSPYSMTDPAEPSPDGMAHTYTHSVPQSPPEAADQSYVDSQNISYTQNDIHRPYGAAGSTNRAYGSSDGGNRSYGSSDLENRSYGSSAERSPNHDPSNNEFRYSQNGLNLSQGAVRDLDSQHHGVPLSSSASSPQVLSMALFSNVVPFQCDTTHHGSGVKTCIHNYVMFYM